MTAKLFSPYFSFSDFSTVVENITIIISYCSKAAFPASAIYPTSRASVSETGNVL